MATHVKVIAVLFIVGGVGLACLSLFFFFGMGTLAAIIGSSGEHDAGVASAVLGMTGVALGAIMGVLSIPWIVTGWGMLRLRPWSRIAGIVLAALSLPKIPLGTIFGVYALVILFKKETEALFVATPAVT